MVTVAIMQPTYLPWLGYFELVCRADAFVFFDDAQYVKQNWQNRNRLKDAGGQAFWLTVPLQKHALQIPINEVEIAYDGGNAKWPEKHLGSIRAALGKAPFFPAYYPDLAAIIASGRKRLSDLTVAIIRYLADCIGLNGQDKFHLSSALPKGSGRAGNLLCLCQDLGADRYYSPRGANAYLEAEEHLFRGAGIAVHYQDWEHPVYPQQHGEFVPYLSAFDALCNIGGNGVLALLRAREEQNGRP